MGGRNGYIPSNDAEFDIFYKNCVNTIADMTAGDKPEWTHIPIKRVEDLSDGYAEWYTAYAVTLTPHTDEDVRNKNRVRKAKEKQLRRFLKEFIFFSAAVTDAQRDLMKLPNYDGIRTPGNKPNKMVEFYFALRSFAEVLIHFREMGSSRKARPYGCNGALIVYAILDKPPANVEELLKHELATHTPFPLTFRESDRGKTVYVAMCWQNTKGQLGPWSPIQWTIIP